LNLKMADGEEGIVSWVKLGVDKNCPPVCAAELSPVRKRRLVSYLTLPSMMGIWGSPASLWNYAAVFATLRGVRLLQLPFEGLVEDKGQKGIMIVYKKLC